VTKFLNFKFLDFHFNVTKLFKVIVQRN